MFFIYYDDDGNITSVTNIQDESFGKDFLEIDKTMYNGFVSGDKITAEYLVVENIKIKGKKHVVRKNIDGDPESNDQPNGIIKQLTDFQDNSIIFLQDKQTKKFSIINKMEDDICALFAVGEDYPKDYFIVDKKNRFILLDKIVVNLKELASVEKIDIQLSTVVDDISILCFSNHVNHIHVVKE